MSDSLFGRHVWFVVFDFEDEKFFSVEDLKIDFDITSTSANEPNTANIQIHNLGESNRSLLTEKSRNIEFYGGYEENRLDLKLLFRGKTTQVRSFLSESTWITEIIAQDTVKNLKFHNIFSKTYEAGTKYSEIFTDFADFSAYYTLFDSTLKQHTLTKSVSFYGEVTKELRKFGRMIKDKFHYQILHGTLEVYKASEFAVNISIVPEVNSETGLLSRPQVTKEGVIVDSLLDGRLLPGRLVHVDMSNYAKDLSFSDAAKIKSKKQLSSFVIQAVTHTGSNKDDTEFKTTATCIAQYVIDILRADKKEANKE